MIDKLPFTNNELIELAKLYSGDHSEIELYELIVAEIKARLAL